MCLPDYVFGVAFTFLHTTLIHCRLVLPVGWLAVLRSGVLNADRPMDLFLRLQPLLLVNLTELDCSAGRLTIE